MTSDEAPAARALVADSIRTTWAANFFNIIGIVRIANIFSVPVRHASPINGDFNRQRRDVGYAIDADASGKQIRTLGHGSQRFQPAEASTHNSDLLRIGNSFVDGPLARIEDVLVHLSADFADRRFPGLQLGDGLLNGLDFVKLNADRSDRRLRIAPPLGAVA